MSKENVNIGTLLLDSRIVFIGSEINSEMANAIVSALLYLDSLGHEPIKLYINSPGGSLNAGYAIFSKRFEVKDSSVDQTENAIQNIILEQMEKLQGILIATTNFESSLDPAFERRFLFKVKFGRPGIEAKKRIWMDKLNGLSEVDASVLAESYNLSGGEIDNVTRKVIMNKVLTGEAYTLDYLKELCEQEKFTNQRAVIGF